MQRLRIGVLFCDVGFNDVTDLPLTRGEDPLWVIGIGVFWLLVRMLRWWMRTRAAARADDEQIFTRNKEEP